MKQRPALFAALLTLAGAAAPAQAPAQTPAPAGVYIPADKRHLGLSRFDLLPFTDRKKGDPDRYRALNPKYVKHRDGHYYFLLTTKPGAPLLDKTGKIKGTLTETDVAVDLTDSIEAVNGDGKAARYVLVEDKGYIARSALPSAAEIKAGKWFYFPLKPGQHPLLDGRGIVRGTLAADSVRLNYGQQKQINGAACYYAFSTTITLTGTGKKSGASGWVPASAIQKGNDPQYPSIVVAKMQPSPTAADTFTTYEVTGGDPMAVEGKDPEGKPRYKFGYTNSTGKFIEYKVLPGVLLAGRESVRATDYLKRNDDVINLGFNVSGVSNDTYRVSSAARPLLFHRSSCKDATAVIDLFYPTDTTHDGFKPIGKMTFVYGFIDETPNKRWGWIPLDALKLSTAR